VNQKEHIMTISKRITAALGVLATTAALVLAGTGASTADASNASTANASGAGLCLKLFLGLHEELGC
jgi:hypothetical protein